MSTDEELIQPPRGDVLVTSEVAAYLRLHRSTIYFFFENRIVTKVSKDSLLWQRALSFAAMPFGDCHELEAGHPAQIWPRAQFDDKAVLCGACGQS